MNDKNAIIEQTNLAFDLIQKLNLEVFNRPQKNELLIKNHIQMNNNINKNKSSIKLEYYIIYCNPLEKKEDVIKTINVMLKLKKSYFFI